MGEVGGSRLCVCERRRDKVVRNARTDGKLPKNPLWSGWCGDSYPL